MASPVSHSSTILPICTSDGSVALTHRFSKVAVLATRPSGRCVVAGLERTLFVKDGDQGCLAVNFDSDVLVMLQEVQFWEGMRFTGPYVAIEVNAQRQKLKLLRETALAIVRDYNNVRPVRRTSLSTHPVPCRS